MVDLEQKERNFLLAIFTSHMPKITKKGAKSDTFQGKQKASQPPYGSRRVIPRALSRFQDLSDFTSRSNFSDGQPLMAPATLGVEPRRQMAGRKEDRHPRHDGERVSHRRP